MFCHLSHRPSQLSKKTCIQNKEKEQKYAWKKSNDVLLVIHLLSSNLCWILLIKKRNKNDLSEVLDLFVKPAWEKKRKKNRRIHCFCFFFCYQFYWHRKHWLNTWAKWNKQNRYVRGRSSSQVWVEIFAFFLDFLQQYIKCRDKSYAPVEIASVGSTATSAWLWKIILSEWLVVDNRTPYLLSLLNSDFLLQTAKHVTFNMSRSQVCDLIVCRCIADNDVGIAD